MCRHSDTFMHADTLLNSSGDPPGHYRSILFVAASTLPLACRCGRHWCYCTAAWSMRRKLQLTALRTTSSWKQSLTASFFGISFSANMDKGWWRPSCPVSGVDSVTYCFIKFLHTIILLSPLDITNWLIYNKNNFHICRFSSRIRLLHEIAEFINYRNTNNFWYSILYSNILTKSKTLKIYIL